MVYLFRCLILSAIVSSTVSLYAQYAVFESADFRKADSVAALYPGYPLRDLRDLAGKLTASLSKDEEKFRAIYSWVCSNIENDYQYYVTNKHKREKLHDNPDALKEWNKKFSVLVFNKLLHEHKTVCSGYAYLIKELAYHAGLPCVIIDGYGRTAEANIGGPGIANHSWNAIQLNGKWYLCDATWSSGSIDTKKKVFVKKFDESYFLPDPSIFIRNHYPLDSAWILEQHKPTLQEFLNGPLVYGSVYRYGITELSPATFALNVAKGEKFTIRFKPAGDRMIRDVQLHINGSHITPRVKGNSDGSYTIDHIFKLKGKYVVHVLLDTQYAVTYTVIVNNADRSEVTGMVPPQVEGNR